MTHAARWSMAVALWATACSSSARRDEPARATEPARDAARDAAIDALVVDAALARDAAVDLAVDAPDPLASLVVDAPMRWSDERARLTLEYRRRHSDADARDLAIAPRAIVLHYTGGGSAKATRGYFDDARIEASRAALARGGAVNVSAHFLVDRDGTIYQLQPPTRFARHCIGLNHLAIGVENVGDDATWPLTEAQVAANAALVRALAQRYPIEYLFGHHEVMQLRDRPFFVEREATYRNDKPDPGPRFMARVRAALGELAPRGP